MSAAPPIRRKAVIAWCMYDFANSAFTTLVVTFVYATYFTSKIAENEIEGTSLWSRGVGLSAVLVALLSPLFGAIADRGGHRKLFLLLTTVITIVGCIFLYPVGPGETIRALFWFVIANVSFEMGLVFYNAFLPDISTTKNLGRISGYGWSLGYVGGLLALVVALVCFIQPETPWFGFSRDGDEHVRATNLLVAGWFAVFSIPIFLWLPSNKRIGVKSNLTSGFRQIAGTVREIRKYRQVLRLLLARVFYNDGLVTIFAFGGIYAQGTFDFTGTDLLMFGIVINVAAGVGAFGLGFLDDLLGGKRTLLLSIGGLLFASILAVVAPWQWTFWLAAIFVGIFAGPNQSASRSLLARFAPPGKENEFFGFFAFSGKATALVGPLLLGVVTEMFNSQRAGISVVVIFFLVGGALLFLVDEEDGIKSANQGKENDSPD